MKKVSARLWKRLEALERAGRAEINVQEEVDAIFRKYRGMKACAWRPRKPRNIGENGRGKTRTPSEAPSG